MENTVVIIVDFNVKEFVDIPIGIDASDLIGQSYLSPEGGFIDIVQEILLTNVMVLVEKEYKNDLKIR